MDEPEAGLAFTGQLALPGAWIPQLDQDGLRETAWDDLAVVDYYRRFLDAPERHSRDTD